MLAYFKIKFATATEFRLKQPLENHVSTSPRTSWPLKQEEQPFSEMDLRFDQIIKVSKN
jgi:hypothetical protein